MPYKSVKDIPSFVKKYSIKLQRQWFYVFNSTWKKLTKEGVVGNERETRSFKSANSVLKKQVNKETHSQDYFNHLVDVFLKNLEG